MTGDSRRKRETTASFDRFAETYADSPTHVEGEDLELLAEWCSQAKRPLDVATGAGHTAGAVADATSTSVVAVDAAPSMVETAMSSYDGLQGTVGDAERLPFSADSFDAVTCRIAAHHFPNPRRFVEEVARVTAPGGTVAFEDNVAPEDVTLDAFINDIERLRDPTHGRSHTVSAWRSWFEDAGITVVDTRLLTKTLEYEPWVRRLDTPPDRRATIEERFATANEAVLETFGVEFDAGVVSSFQSPKLLLHGRR